jgi:hypothetical protein
MYHLSLELKFFDDGSYRVQWPIDAITETSLIALGRFIEC